MKKIQVKTAHLLMLIANNANGTHNAEIKKLSRELRALNKAAKAAA